LTLALALALIAFAGCGGGRDTAQRGDTTPRYSIVTKRVEAEPDWDAPLPPDVCFVGSRDYEVEITARSRSGMETASAVGGGRRMTLPRNQGI
jgi:hypothetical protein